MGTVIVLAFLASILSEVQPLHPSCQDESLEYRQFLYPLMVNNGDTEFLPRDLDAKKQLNIQGEYNLYNQKYTGHVWVTSRGVLALTPQTDIEYYFRPNDFRRNGTAFIAAAYSDIDIVAAPDNSHIWYRETTDPELLTRFNGDMQGKFCQAGTSFSATHLIIVTFQRVENFCDHFLADKRDVQEEELHDGRSRGDVKSDRSLEERDFPANTFSANTFQIVYATNGGKSFVMFNYRHICWFDCHTYTRAGFNDGLGTQYEILNSGTVEFGDNDELSNVGKPGRFMYQVDGPVILGPDCHALQ